MSNTRTSAFSAAFILHRRDYSNSSLLLECLTQSEGRFPAIAKGVKRKKQGGMGLLQPFTSLQIRWTGRGEVKTLTQFEPSGPLPRLEGKALYCGFYLNELLMRLLQRNDPHERLFENYARLLDRLARSGVDEAALRYFELDLLEELGYAVTLDQESLTGDPVLPGSCYRHIQEQGLVTASTGEEGGISGQTLISLQQRTLESAQALKEARQLLRKVLSGYIGEKPLKSRELFRQLFPG